ncbi:heterocyst development glycosyltransferase HepC [Myxosarcina sp. GI1(2024)]
MTDNILLTTSKLLNLDLAPTRVTNNHLPPCSLKWRKKKLWIEKTSDRQNFILPALKRQQWLRECLKRSSVEQVCVDSKLGETGIKVWADACLETNKQIFLRIPSNPKILQRQKSFYWQFKRVMDWCGAAILLLILSPILLGVAALMKISSPGSIFVRQWRVGQRGKLFKIYKFRTMVIDAQPQHHQLSSTDRGLYQREEELPITSIGQFLHKYGLDELPQLLNVLKGELSLVGPSPWALNDALGLGETRKERLNVLPGIIGAWSVENRSNLLELDAVTNCDLEYLQGWTLKRDLKILLMSVPRVFSSFGAY